VALADFLRDRAAAFSLSADVNDSPQTADPAWFCSTPRSWPNSCPLRTLG
jgi:hypothetical protein